MKLQLFDSNNIAFVQNNYILSSKILYASLLYFEFLSKILTNWAIIVVGNILLGILIGIYRFAQALNTCCNFFGGSIEPI